MVLPNGTRKRRRRERIASFILSSLVFSTSVAGHCAGHFYNVEAAEGIIGAIAGNFTLWDLATTALGAAGFMIVNDDIQTTAATHLGGNQYTLDYLVQEGLIEVNEKPSYTWDWSGLKSLIADWDNYSDSLPLNKIARAAEDAGIIDSFDDLWIETFKQFVEVGKIGVNKIGAGITAGVQDLSDWIGSAFADNVEVGLSINLPTSFNGRNINSYVVYKDAALGYLYYDLDVQKLKLFAYKDSDYTYVYVANRSNAGVSWYEVVKYGGWNSGWRTQNLGAKGSYYDRAIEARTPIIDGNITIYDNAASMNNAIDIWKNSEEPVVVQSPDVLTPTGAAVAPSTGTWAPSPYLGGLDWPDAWLQPVPAGAWSPAIDDLIDAPALPAPGEAGDVFGGVFDPYMDDSPAIDIPGDDVVPVPTVAPRPTTAAGEGTMDVPYAVVPADPVPAMEDGAGQLPNIGEFFPFCIPGDFVYITKLLWSEDNVRTAPHIYLPLRIPSFNFSYDIDIDFAPFDDGAELLRTLVLITFCIGLAILTKNLIWS